VDILWSNYKNSIRLWIERTKAESSNRSLTRCVADLIWFAHILRSWVKNSPRLCRIWIKYFRVNPSSPTVLKALMWLLQKTLHLFEAKPGEIHGDPNLVTEDAASPVEREQIAKQIALSTNNNIERKDRKVTPSENLRELSDQGITRLDQFKLNRKQLENIRNYLEQRPVYAADVPEFSDQVPRYLNDPESRRFPFGSYAMRDVVQAPELLELTFNPDILAIVENYLGCAPSLFSMHHLVVISWPRNGWTPDLSSGCG